MSTTITTTTTTYATDTIYLFINGQKHIVVRPEPDTSLIQYLRSKNLTGTKLGCNEGGCGACTVMLSHYDLALDRVVNRSVNACLMPLLSCDSCAVVTVEGIGSSRDTLHLIQERIKEYNGSQCGFCTPGIVMSLYTLLRNEPRPSLEQIEQCLDGNLCRCTGYRPILDAARTLVNASSSSSSCCGGASSVGGGGGGGCCGGGNKSGGGGGGCCMDNTPTTTTTTTDDSSTTTTETSTTETSTEEAKEEQEEEEYVFGLNGQKHFIFPPMLKNRQVLEELNGRDIHIKGERVEWFRPSSLESLIRYKTQLLEERRRGLHQNKIKYVIGNSEIAIETRMKHFQYPILVAPTHISQLLTITPTVFHAADDDDDVQEASISNLVRIINQTHEERAQEAAAAAVNGSGDGSDGVNGLWVGSSTTISQLQQQCQSLIKQYEQQNESHKTRGLQSIVDQLRWFASTPIRNAASVGGNLITASPIGDLAPIYMCMNATGLVFNVLTQQYRTVRIRKFFLDYRLVDVSEEEVFVGLFIPFCSQEHEYVKSFKQSRRREDDIAIVNGGMRMIVDGVLNSSSSSSSSSSSAVPTISLVSLNFGGMNKYAVSAPKTEQALLNQPLFHPKTFDNALEVLKQEIALSPMAPGGMIEYRQALCYSFFFKFYQYVLSQVMTAMQQPQTQQPQQPVSEEQQEQPQQEHTTDHSLFDKSSQLDLLRTRHYPSGNQQYTLKKTGTSVGDPEKHTWAHLQVTGEAKYLDDIQSTSGELHAHLVLTTVPLAKIVHVDISRAEEHPGFRGYVDASDVPGVNTVGAVINDEELFVTEWSKSTGQMIGIILADTPTHARYLANLVQVKYDTSDLPHEPLLTIQDAIRHNSYQGDNNELYKGNVQELIERAKQDTEQYEIVSGDLQMGGQEHFYLETNGTLAIPGEQDEMTVISSIQNLTKTQNLIAKVLHVDASKIISKAKRIGGGFGGKETRGSFFSAAIAVAARKYRSPVRFILDRDIDMSISGQRHPFYYKYTAVYNKQSAKIEGLHCEMYCNGGYSLDLSQSVMDRALLSFDNVYNIPHMALIGRVCLTNMPSNTAFRGFGGPQGMLIMEHIIDHVSSNVHLKQTTTDVPTTAMVETPLPPLLDAQGVKLRSNMLYQEGDHTHYGQLLDANRIDPLWNRVASASNYEQRLQSVQQFNKQHRYKKRGIYMIPTKYGISFTASFLNQGGALVHIYHVDGSVLVTHGGIEMGQGLHTKVAQCAASTLGVPLSKVFISETSTDKVPNSSPTAASVGSDLYGGAVVDACRQLNERLESLKKELEEKNGGQPVEWATLVNQAYMRQINLSAQGFYKTPDLHMNWKSGQGRPFSYFTYGTACSEVEVDTLTGDMHVIQTDIVMDVGDSLNPTIDIGQIEGAFTQGLGLFTIEEMIWGDSAHKWIRPGTLFSRGPGVYKIPSFNDVPVTLNVHLLENAPNQHAVYRSKAVGEPPLFLAASVFFAIKDAIRSAREDYWIKDRGLALSAFDPYFAFDSPATPERIRMACCDSITESLMSADDAGNRFLSHLDDVQQNNKELWEQIKTLHYRPQGSF